MVVWSLLCRRDVDDRDAPEHQQRLTDLLGADTEIFYDDAENTPSS
jgi:hypothetical protein